MIMIAFRIKVELFVKFSALHHSKIKFIQNYNPSLRPTLLSKLDNNAISYYLIRMKMAYFYAPSAVNAFCDQP